MKNKYFEYDMKRADYLVKQGFRNRICGIGVGSKGDTYILFSPNPTLYGALKQYSEQSIDSQV